MASGVDLKALSGMIADFFNVSAGRDDPEVIRERIMAGARIDGIHVLQLMSAMLIASVGLNLNSTEAVIGAMLICPLMGTVLAIAFTVATCDMRGLRECAVGLSTQVAVCILTSTLYFVISPISNTTSYLLQSSQATIWDVLLALVGGAAGGLGNSRRDTPSTLIAGVAVATSLMPPLCSVGYGIAVRNLGIAAAALYEFAINVVSIAFGAELVLVALKMPLQADLDGDGIVTEDEERETEEASGRLRRRVVIGSIIFALPCLFISARVVHQQMSTNGTLLEVVDTYDTELTTLELMAVCPEFADYRIGVEDSFNGEYIVRRIVATVVTKDEIDEADQQTLEKLVRLNAGEVDEVTFEVEAT